MLDIRVGDRAVAEIHLCRSLSRLAADLAIRNNSDVRPDVELAFR